MAVTGWRGQDHPVRAPTVPAPRPGRDRPVELVLVHRDEPAACAASIAAFRAQGVALSVTVVDNGSAAAASGALARIPGVRVLPTGRNAGFGPGANVGLRAWLADADGGDWVVVAPHDALPEPGCLRRLLAACVARPRAGLACAEFGTDERPVLDVRVGGLMEPVARGRGWQPAGFPHGTLLLASRACLAEIGLFDERYFAYIEEVDLGARATAAGWDVGMVWDALVVNPQLRTPAPVKEYLQLRNTLLLVADHGGTGRAWTLVAVVLLDTAYRALRPGRRPLGFVASARLRAVADYLRGVVGPPPAAVR